MKNLHETKAFTLIELLTVIAVIAILATIMIPVLGHVRTNARKTAARSQFSQWAQAIELFRMEYGFYPVMHTASEPQANDLFVNGGGHNDGTRFFEALTGRGFDDGDRIVRNDPGFDAGNTRAAQFYSFADHEIDSAANRPIIRDFFENTQIVVMFDRNLNGVIELGSDGDYNLSVGGLPEVRSERTGRSFRPTAADFPDERVRASVIFYSAGHGDELLMSWK